MPQPLLCPPQKTDFYRAYVVSAPCSVRVIFPLQSCRPFLFSHPPPPLLLLVPKPPPLNFPNERARICPFRAPLADDTCQKKQNKKNTKDHSVIFLTLYDSSSYFPCIFSPSSWPQSWSLFRFSLCAAWHGNVILFSSQPVIDFFLDVIRVSPSTPSQETDFF